MQSTRRETKELKRKAMSKNPRQRYGQSFSHISTFFPKELETYKEAIGCSEKENCLQAMQDELKSLSDTNTSTLVYRPKYKNIVPENGVKKKKTKADGGLETYKVSYVAIGFKRIEGLDYSKTFAPTSNFETFDTLFL